jgi:uncharacterized membrane protein
MAGMKNRIDWKWVIVVTAFCLLHLLVFTRVFYNGGSDIDGYYRYASFLGQGQLPYRDFSVEYPPGALLIFYLPSLFSGNISQFTTAFTFEMLLFDIAGMLMVLGLGRRARISPWICLIGYTLAMFAVNSIMVQRFDIVPAVITLGAIYAFSKGNYKTAWAVLAIGTMTKLYPALLAPLFFICQWRRGGLRSVFPSIFTFLVVLEGISIPLLIFNADGFISSFTVQSGRALQLESLYSSFLLLGQSLGIVSAQPVQGPISLDIVSPLAEPLAKSAFLFMGACLLAVYYFYYRNCRKNIKPSSSPVPDAQQLAELLNYAFITITVFMLTNKVFSPQFMVWLYPLFPLVSGRLRPAVWVAFLLAACLTWYIYPLNYWDLVDTEQSAVNALILRNVLMLFMAGLLLGEKTPGTSDDGKPSRLKLRRSPG